MRSRLQELESQHQNVVHQVNQLDHDIKIKLKPFEHELRESSQERQAIQKRQQEVEEKSVWFITFFFILEKLKDKHT